MKTRFFPFIFGVVFLFWQVIPSVAQEQCSSCVVVYGDSRMANGFFDRVAKAVFGWTRRARAGGPGDEIQKKIAGNILKVKPLAVFHTGDFVATGGNAGHWRHSGEITAELRKNTDFFRVQGNHDVGGEKYAALLKFSNKEKRFSVDRGGIRFIALDTEDKVKAGSPQYNWLEAELNSLSDKDKFVALVFHRPVFSSGQQGTNRKLVKALVPLFEKYGVNIVFTGHNHAYERLYKDGVHYIVTGGGGAPLHNLKDRNQYSRIYERKHNYSLLSVSGENLSVKVFDEENRQIDAFTVPKRKAK